MKKLLLSLGSLAAVVTPVVAVVSCGDKKTNTTTNTGATSNAAALETLRQAEAAYKDAGLMVWKSGDTLKANSFTSTDIVDGTSTVLKASAHTTAYTKQSNEQTNITKFTNMATKATEALLKLVGAANVNKVTAFTTAAQAAYKGAANTWAANITAVNTAAKAIVSQLPDANNAADGTAGMTTLEDKNVLNLSVTDKNVLKAMVLLVKVYKTLAFLG